jgi:poly(3-hydroxybutyrate) depolymerase
VARQWQDIQAFSFSPTATHLLLRRRPAAAAAGAGRAGGDAPAASPAPGGAGAAAEPAGPRGVDVTIHDLRAGRDQLLGSVADFSFNKAGDFLAYTVDAAVKDTNGLFVFDLPGGRVLPLENDAKLYNRLIWNERGTALAVLKGLDVEKMRERNNVLVVYPDVKASVTSQGPGPQPITLDPSKNESFPKGWVVSDRAAIGFSDDSSRVYFGMKEQVPTPEARRANRDENADVDVWNTVDERIVSLQMNRAEADRNFTYRSALVVSTGTFVKLADPTMKDIDIALTGKWAVGRDTRGKVTDWGPQSADFYRVNTMTGERTPMMKGATMGGNPGITPNGKTYLYWKDSKFQAWDLESGSTKTVGGTVSFINVEDDHPGPKIPYPIVGHTPDGSAAIASQRYDLWLVPLDGSAPRNITGEGTKTEVRFRPAVFAPLDPMADYGPGGIAAYRQQIDLSKPLMLSAYGEWTKKAGYYELSGGKLRELIWDDASFSTPARAAKADKYMFTRQTFVEYPDLRISGPDFKQSTKITDANPQQGEYLWGKRVLFDYKNKNGVRLQGILAVPDDYKQGEKRPMLVTFYEKNSQNMHRYNAPSLLTGMGSSPMQAVTEGYLTMLADVYFNTGSSHSDMLDCVEAATRKVIEMGYADPKRIGVNGHSYGGEGAAFIATRSKMFAAIGMGAGVTDLFSDFNQSWGWTYQVTGGSGANGNDYYMEGQGRWGFAPWDNPEVYHFESALTHVREVVSPVLIMHGTADPTVSFTEGMNFYNALRFNKKNAIMLAYVGEGHGLTGLANRKDMTTRYFEFFNHYLKGAPAPKWLKEGVPYLDKNK